MSGERESEEHGTNIQSQKRARTVAKLIKELGAIKHDMYEEKDYISHKAQHPQFLVSFRLAKITRSYKERLSTMSFPEGTSG